jgi:molybdopterin molybdotransferase
LDDPSAKFRIVDEIRAGDWKPRPLERGQAVRIATGGALPADGLQVVMKEDVALQSGALCVFQRSGERNIRFRGEDARVGQQLVGIGTVLSPGAIGLLASVGCTQPLVTRLPRVLHLATGNEIVPPEQAPSHGQIRDSNSTLVREFLGQWGIVPEQRRVAEDEARLASELQKANSGTNLLLISGGASVGEHDFTRRLLEGAGFKIHVSKTTARPGKPLIVAQRGDTLAFGLPGNPLAHFVCLNLYVRAALVNWSAVAEKLELKTGRLEADLVAGGNSRETFWPARWTVADGMTAVTPLRWSSSGDLTALADANALVCVKSGAQKLPRDSRVEFWPC